MFDCVSLSLFSHLHLSDEFMVSPVEGELRVRKDVELDRETTAFYNITVTAQDLGTPSRNSSVSVYYTHRRKQARTLAISSLTIKVLQFSLLCCQFS